MGNDQSDNGTRLLEGAYAIKTSEDNINYYREFAALYDDDFAASLGYIYPQMLASVFSEYAQSSDSKIVDIGCGTGLVGQALRASKYGAMLCIDGIDISPEMLATAKDKDIYQSLIQADLTKGIPSAVEHYDAVLSAGTFTFGHLGPEVLPALLSIGRSNTLFCIGVNSEHYQQQGFSAVRNSMADENLINPPVLETMNIYNTNDNTKEQSTHAKDTATVIVYRQI